MLDPKTMELFELVKKESNLFKSQTRIRNHLPKAKYVSTVVIDPKRVYVKERIGSDAQGNIARAKLDLSHVEFLENSFRQLGCDESQPFMVVVKRPRQENGKVYTHELIDGEHRLRALQNGNYKEWVFDVIEIEVGTKESWYFTRYKFQLNNRPVSKQTVFADAVRGGCFLYEEGFFGADEKLIAKNIEAWLDEDMSLMPKQTRGKALREIIKKKGIYTDFLTITASQAKEICEEDEKKYRVNGQEDKKRKAKGYSVREGYEREVIVGAMLNWLEHEKSYFNLHTKTPTDHKDLIRRRNKMLRSFKSLEDAILKSAKCYNDNGEWPWWVESFFVQDQEKEKDLGNFIQVSKTSKPFLKSVA